MAENTIRFKRCYVGMYEATYRGWEISLYKTEAGYWSSTSVRGKYGDDNWLEEIITSDFDPYTKKSTVEAIKGVIDSIENEETK